MTPGDIDQLRNLSAILHNLKFGPPLPSTELHPSVFVSLNTIEDMTRTYIVAGIKPDELRAYILGLPSSEKFAEWLK